MSWICLFLGHDFLEIQATVEYHIEMQMDLCLDLELSMGNYLKMLV